MNKITVEIIVNAPIDKVWKYWNTPEHITKWAFASDDWEAPKAENDLRTGGKFSTTMAAKNPPAGEARKSTSFDFNGIYTAVKEHERIEYDMEDGRHVKVEFSQTPEGIKVVETFDPENENSEELQRNGWQSILNNFKKHVETL